MQKFKTSFRLWAVCSLVLFVPCWFMPFLAQDDTVFAAMLRCFRAGLPMTDFFVFALIFAIPAIVIGWVMQAIITICVRRKREEKPAS